MSLLKADRVGATLLLTLQDPDRRNILSQGLCDELSAAIAAANEDEDLRAIVITGAGSAFCAGADLDDLAAAASGDTVAVHAVYQSFMSVAESKLLTIAAVNGPAVGAGMNMALACDIRIAGANALFDTRFLKIGLHPGGGHSWLLLRAIGWGQAARLLLTSTAVRADEAKEIGLVQQVVAPDLLIEAALKLAEGCSEISRELLIRTKQSLRIAAASDHRRTFEHETAEQLHSMKQPPFRALLQRMKAAITSR